MLLSGSFLSSLFYFDCILLFACPSLCLRKCESVKYFAEISFLIMFTLFGTLVNNLHCVGLGILMIKQNGNFTVISCNKRFLGLSFVHFCCILVSNYRMYRF
jgi:hypothetical protein